MTRQEEIADQIALAVNDAMIRTGRKMQFSGGADFIISRADQIIATCPCERLVKACGPFVEAFGFWSAMPAGMHDDTELDDQGMISFGDLRALAAAVKKAKGLAS